MQLEMTLGRGGDGKTYFIPHSLKISLHFTPFFNKFSGGEHGESLGGDDFLIPIHFSFTYFTLDRDT